MFYLLFLILTCSWIRMLLMTTIANFTVFSIAFRLVVIIIRWWWGFSACDHKWFLFWFWFLFWRRKISILLSRFRIHASFYCILILLLALIIVFYWFWLYCLISLTLTISTIFIIPFCLWNRGLKTPIDIFILTSPWW